MARKHKKGQGGGGQPQQQRPQGGAGGGGGGGGGWGPLRDSIRRDVEQAVTSLAFAERLHSRLDTQRRLFQDFPRSIEQLRSGAMERLTAALSRLYEGGQGFDLQRFLRDLPLATAQLAAQERAAQKNAASKSAAKTAVEAKASQGGEAKATEGDGAEAPAAAAEASATGEAASEAPAADAPVSEAPAAGAEAAQPAEAAAPEAAAPEKPEPPSPRLELRSKLLTAAPNLAKAAQSFRRNVATLRRAALPRRSPGPWRTDREVLEEARRAVEFVQKLFDTYAEAWADQALPRGLGEDAAAETDRFLAWTQLDRYAELSLLASTGQARASKPGQQIVSAPDRDKAAASLPPPPVTEASAGAGGVTEPDKGEEKPAEG